MKTYTLKISEEQARILANACEFVARIHMGQLDPVADQVMSHESADIPALRDQLRGLQPLITGMSRNAYLSISSDKLSDFPRIAWELHQVIRHRLAWDRKPDGGFQVYFDKPHLLTDHPLAEITGEEVEKPPTSP